jgi:predicted ArsR family transcriptional regulator
MVRESWRGRLLQSTRGRVLQLLRRETQTVSDLAAELALTDNAVRLHIAALERDGLVERGGTRREWTGKPAVLYRTTVDAEALFPKAYAAALGAVLDELGATRSGREAERLLRGAGTRLGLAARSRHTETTARVQHAAQVLTALGGLVEVEAAEGGWRLQGYSCPLDALLPHHPQACLLAESLVSALIGVTATECCERGERPRCAFRIPAITE